MNAFVTYGRWDGAPDQHVSTLCAMHDYCKVEKHCPFCILMCQNNVIFSIAFRLFKKMVSSTYQDTTFLILTQRK